DPDRFAACRHARLRCLHPAATARGCQPARRCRHRRGRSAAQRRRQYLGRLFEPGPACRPSRPGCPRRRADGVAGGRDADQPAPHQRLAEHHRPDGRGPGRMAGRPRHRPECPGPAGDRQPLRRRPGDQLAAGRPGGHPRQPGLPAGRPGDTDAAGHAAEPAAHQLRRRHGDGCHPPARLAVELPAV
ncbi:MAG: hypothetical protein AVDCRST_MAG27-1904, partial [uncultured Craurococcus sp.]